MGKGGSLSQACFYRAWEGLPAHSTPFEKCCLSLFYRPMPSDGLFRWGLQTGSLLSWSWFSWVFLSNILAHFPEEQQSINGHVGVTALCHVLRAESPPRSYLNMKRKQLHRFCLPICLICPGKPLLFCIPLTQSRLVIPLEEGHVFLDLFFPVWGR